MAYSILTETGNCAPIRLLADNQPDNATWPCVQVCDILPSETKWVCDPCASSSKRYQITWPSGHATTYKAWWEVILMDDDARDIAVKCEHATKVKLARVALETARKELQRLNG